MDHSVAPVAPHVGGRFTWLSSAWKPTMAYFTSLRVHEEFQRHLARLFVESGSSEMPPKIVIAAAKADFAIRVKL